MIKLFATGTTRALPPCILMEEAAVPYELRVIDIRKRDRPRDFLALQLQGRLPALVDGDLCLDQSIAVLIYLAEKFGVLLPNDPAAKMEALRLLMVASTDIMFGHAIIFRLMRKNIDGSLDGLLYDYRQSLMGDIAKCDQTLRQREYLANEISIADLMLYAIVGQYDQGAIRRVGFDALDSWIEKMRSRASVKSAEAKNPYLYDVSGTLGNDDYKPDHDPYRHARRAEVSV